MSRRVAVSAAGKKLLEQSRSRKNAYLDRRLRALSADERTVLARAAVIVERMLEEPS
jgi:hypothetical protein